MRPLPTPPAAGKPVSATFMRRLIDAIRERTVIAGSNVTLKFGPNGTVVNAKATTGGGAAAGAAVPWDFRCTVDPESEERTGGWTNCRVQVGANTDVTDANGKITGTDATADGKYYAEVDLAAETAEVKRVGLDEAIPASDLANSKINLYVGTVRDAKLENGIGYVPVAWKWM